MQIPDCCDPVCQEEKRQADWDRFVEKLPVCGCCGHSIYPQDIFYKLKIQKETIVVCADCKSDMDEGKQFLEY